MHYTKAISALRKLKSEMPTLVANEMVNFALDNLEAEKDVHGAPLKPRKSTAPRNHGRRILKDKGDGDRSIRISKKTASVVEITANEYMEAHNIGAHINTTANVRAHSRRRKGRVEQVSAHQRKVDIQLPQREFFAPSPELDKRILNTLTKMFNQLLK